MNNKLILTGTALLAIICIGCAPAKTDSEAKAKKTSTPVLDETIANTEKAINKVAEDIQKSAPEIKKELEAEVVKAGDQLKELNTKANEEIVKGVKDSSYPDLHSGDDGAVICPACR